MNNLNSVNISGNLTADAELKYTSNNKAIATFTVAVNRKWGDTEEVSFIDCKMFGKLAESISKYMDKGKQVVIGGRFSQERWQTNEGNNRSKIVVIADFVQIVGGDRQSNVNGDGYRAPQDRSCQKNGTPTQYGNERASGGYSRASGASFPGPEQFDDDIPF